MPAWCQFKDYFTGRARAAYPRATTSQKCVRAGGKHNDLDNVGYTARHHTFFEMLGNFSFGDYFKEHAIELAWKLVTKEFGLPKDKLTVTVYHRRRSGVRPVAEDRRPARAAGSSASPTRDNFWAMGDTGPCGPCSEIFYDHGEAIPGGPPGSAGCRRRPLHRDLEPRLHAVRAAARRRARRSAASVDRYRHGAGAHRRGAAGRPRQLRHRPVQDADRRLGRCSSACLPRGRLAPATASSPTICVPPSFSSPTACCRPTRAAAMCSAASCGAPCATRICSVPTEPVMYRLVPTLVAEMGRAYPELVRAESLIAETLRLEETRFRRTLARGLTLLDEATVEPAAGATLAGDVAFKPLRHLRLPARPDAGRAEGARHRASIIDGFESAMEKQKAEARALLGGVRRGADRGDLVPPARVGSGRPSSSAMRPRRPRARSWRWSRAARRFPRRKAGEEVAIVVNQTPFYAESGGQVADTGHDREREGRARCASRTCRSAPTVCSSISARSRRGRSRSAMPCGSRSTARGAP